MSGDFVPESGTGNSSRRWLYTGEFADGSKLMVEEWPDGRMTAAIKPPRELGSWGDPVWGPPIELERDKG